MNPTADVSQQRGIKGSGNAPASRVEKGKQVLHANFLRVGRFFVIPISLVPALPSPAAMEACGRAGQWSKALGLLAEVRDKGLQPDAVTLNAVMDALGRSEVVARTTAVEVGTG